MGKGKRLRHAQSRDLSCHQLAKDKASLLRQINEHVNMSVAGTKYTDGIRWRALVEKCGATNEDDDAGSMQGWQVRTRSFEPLEVPHEDFNDNFCIFDVLHVSLHQ